MQSVHVMQSAFAVRAKVAVAVVMLFAAALSGAPVKAQPAVVTMLTGSDPYYLPILLAGENGYFKDEGIDVSIRMFPSGTDAMLAFRSIGAEFLAAGDAPSLVLWSGDDVVGIAPIYASAANLFGIVRADIKTAADLKGRKIGTRKGSTADYFLTTYLTKNGVEPSLVNVVNLGPEECTPALLSGNVDGFFMWRPYPTVALKMMGDKARELTTASGYYLEQIYLTANRKFAEANPTTTEKILKAIRRAVSYVNEEPGKSATIIAHKIKGSIDIVMPVIETKPYALHYGRENREQLTKLVDFLLQNGKLKTPVSLEKAMDTRYLNDVDGSLVEK